MSNEGPFLTDSSTIVLVKSVISLVGKTRGVLCSGKDEVRYFRVRDSVSKIQFCQVKPTSNTKVLRVFLSSNYEIINK